MTQITNPDGKIWLALKGLLGTFTECKIMYPMDAYKPTAKDKFVIVQQVSLNSGDAIPINPSCGERFNGFMSLGVCVPVDWEYSELLGLAGRVADHFPNGDRLTYGDAVVHISGRPRVYGSVSLQAPWNRIEVRVPWSCWG